MKYVLAIDPGIRGSGIAEFCGGELIRARYVANPSPPKENIGARALFMAREIFNTCGGVHEIVIEWPKVYARGKSQGDPADLLPLVGVGMAVAGLVGARFGVIVRSYEPSEWKGQIPKGAAFVGRVKLRLEGTERSAIDLPIGSLAHNVWDAIGLGLHHLGRFERVRVFPKG